MEEGCLAGISPQEAEEWTWGETAAAVRAHRRRTRERGQMLSVIAARAAERAAQCLAGERLPPVYEHFPFWTEDEVRALEVERYRQIMQRHAAAGVRREEG